MKKLFLLSLALITVAPLARAQYTFGTQVQSTASASLTYNSGSGVFQYADTANLTDDSAYLPLSGDAATLITTSTGWTVSVAVNLAARSLTSTSTTNRIYSPDVGVALGILYSNGANSYMIGINLSQVNNTGTTGVGDNINTDYPNNFYGTIAEFSASTNGVDQATTPSGSSSTFDGDSYEILSGSTFNGVSTQSISAATGVLTVSYNASTNIMTGYYNGTAIGSYVVPGAASNPSLSLAVFGFSGEGATIAANSVSASNFYVDPFGGTVTGTNLSKSSWFGHYSLSSYPVVYQYYLGYEYAYPVNGGAGGVYLYDYGSGHFWFTQSSDFPYLYDFSLNTYLYYYEANTPHRHFYNFATGQVITL